MKLEANLVKQGMLSKKDLEKALTISRQTYRSLPLVLVENGFVEEEPLLRLLADQHGLNFVALGELVIDDAAIRSVSAKFASHYLIMPVRLQAPVLTIALSDPLDMSPVEDIQTNLGYQVERVLACRSDILDAIRRSYGIGADTVEKILQESSHEEAEPVAESHDLAKMADDASVVSLVNQLLQEAIDERATDIHFEAGRDSVDVRRRIDGVLYPAHVASNIRVLYPAIISRIKLMARLNIVERRIPQDGRSRVTVGGKNYDLRISVVPALHGENVVIRILPTTMLFNLEELGLSPAHRAALGELINQPHGLIFVTGPTGSGKSTTLYACLRQLNQPGRKIITIEDPVEYELKGITQTQINPKIGLTFATALRSMLRHDPDIMMVGEVRDRETAEIAIQTAMTGHLVLSTLHTNDAASGAVRLIDMGIDPYLITSTVRAFAAQRLVKTICTKCKESYEIDGATRYRGTGCKACKQTGYSGRIAVCEFLPLKPEIQELILDRASSTVLREKAMALGMVSLAQDGQEKAARGITTLEEVIRVTSI